MIYTFIVFHRDFLRACVLVIEKKRKREKKSKKKSNQSKSNKQTSIYLHNIIHFTTGSAVARTGNVCRLLRG